MKTMAFLATVVAVAAVAFAIGAMIDLLVAEAIPLKYSVGDPVLVNVGIVGQIVAIHPHSTHPYTVRIPVNHGARRTAKERFAEFEISSIEEAFNSSRFFGEPTPAEVE